MRAIYSKSIVEKEASSNLVTFTRLLRLFIPILGVTCCNALFPVLEKLFFARISVDAFNGGVSSFYASQIFQAPLVAIALMCQVFVGRWQGAKEWQKIGPGVWQFIWFSIFSSFLIIPAGLIYGKFYFFEKSFESVVWPYYTFTLFTAFLYPLGATLSSFYLGLGKPSLVLYVNIGAQLIRVALCYYLVLGIEGWLPSLGLMGGVISSVIAQGSVCLILLTVFLQSKYANLYKSREWFLKIKLFWECVYSGLFRGIHRILTYACWASIAHLMTIRGGDFSIILSIGGTLFVFLPFFADAIFETQVTIVSQILGMRNYLLLNKAFQTTLRLVGTIIIICTIPLILFPMPTFHYLFPDIILGEGSVRLAFFGVWLSFAFFIFCALPVGHLLAFKDTQFFLYVGLFNWVNGFLLMYFMIEKVGIAADHFWVWISIMHGSTALIYYWRMKILQERATSTYIESGSLSTSSA